MASLIGTYQGVIPDSGGLCSIAFGNPPAIYTGFICLASKIDQKRKIAEELAKKANIYFALRPAYEDILTSQHSNYNTFNQFAQPTGTTDPIYVCRYHNKETRAILKTTEITDLDANIRIQLLFQYIYAMHQVYTQYGRQATNCKIQVVQLRSSQSAVLDIRRREQLYDRFTVPAMDYQILLTLEELDKAPEKADDGYRVICGLLFPNMPLPTPPPFLKDFVDYLKTPGTTWDKENDYPWGPCMLLFYPLFSYTNDDLRPQAKQAGDVASIEKGYLKSPFGQGEKAELELDVEITAATEKYAELKNKAIIKNPTPFLKELVDLYLNPTKPNADTILAKAYNDLNKLYDYETNAAPKVKNTQGNDIDIKPYMTNGVLYKSKDVTEFCVVDKDNKRSPMRVQFHCAAIIDIFLASRAPMFSLNAIGAEILEEYQKYALLVQKPEEFIEKTLGWFMRPESIIFLTAKEIGITTKELTDLVQDKKMARFAAVRAYLKATVKTLRATYYETRNGDKDGVVITGTPEIKAGFAKLLYAYGAEKPIFEESKNVLLKSNANFANVTVFGSFINSDSYVENSKLKDNPLQFYAYEGKDTYTSGPARIKNGAYIVLELIARASIPVAKDTTRPSPDVLKEIVGDAKTVKDENAQKARIAFILHAFDPTYPAPSAGPSGIPAAPAAAGPAGGTSTSGGNPAATGPTTASGSPSVISVPGGVSSSGSPATTPAAAQNATKSVLATKVKIDGSKMFGADGQTFQGIYTGYAVNNPGKLPKLGLAGKSAADIIQVIGNDAHRQGGLLHAMWGVEQNNEVAIVRGLSMANISAE